jgi:hypothetical protein
METEPTVNYVKMIGDWEEVIVPSLNPHLSPLYGFSNVRPRGSLPEDVSMEIEEYNGLSGFIASTDL